MFEPSSDPFENAYARGRMWGIAGGRVDQCPYHDEALTEWWVRGWEAGAEVWSEHPGTGVAAGRHTGR